MNNMDISPNIDIEKIKKIIDSTDFASHGNMINDCLNKLHEKLELQKQQLLKDRLIAKGYKEIVDNMEGSLFPRVASIREKNWTY